MDILIDELIYESNTIKIFKDNCIEINDKFITYDYIEAVSYISKMVIKNEIWEFKLPSNFYNMINPINSLYWLSGGDELWLDTKYDWCDYFEHYNNKFYDFQSDFKSCKILKDVKHIIQEKYNLDKFYEFFLSDIHK